MKASLMCSETSGRPATYGNSAINVIALCDGLIGGVYAHEAIASLGNACDKGMLVSSSCWSFDMLSRPAAEELGMGIAMRADLLVIAGFAEVPLPVLICSWLEKLHFNRNGTGPAIAVFYPELPEHSMTTMPMCDFLRELTSACGTNFACSDTFDAQIEDGLMQDLLQHQRLQRFPEAACTLIEQEWHFAG